MWTSRYSVKRTGFSVLQTNVCLSHKIVCHRSSIQQLDIVVVHVELASDNLSRQCMARESSWTYSSVANTLSVCKRPLCSRPRLHIALHDKLQSSLTSSISSSFSFLPPCHPFPSLSSSLPPPPSPPSPCTLIPAHTSFPDAHQQHYKGTWLTLWGAVGSCC